MAVEIGEVMGSFRLVVHYIMGHSALIGLSEYACLSHIDVVVIFYALKNFREISIQKTLKM